MKTRPLFQHIASALCAFENCKRSGNSEWQANHEATIDGLCAEFMPSGSGINCGTEFDWDQSNPDRLVFTFSFHHMNEGGMYDGWTEHKAIVRPSLQFGFDLKITGRDRNGIKDYLHETFHFALETTLEHTATGFVSPERQTQVVAYKAGIANGTIC